MQRTDFSQDREVLQVERYLRARVFAVEGKPAARRATRGDHGLPGGLVDLVTDVLSAVSLCAPSSLPDEPSRIGAGGRLLA
ncbi:hypothetical protein ACWGKW_11760 [Streptomyces sp. NPDC054766]